MQNILSSLALVMLGAPLSATDATQAGMEPFEKVRPILEQHCYRCHSTAAKKQRGGLLLDSRDGLRKGGDSGAAIVPDKPEKSLLLKAVRQTGKLKMPPKGKLPDSAIADIEAWIKKGAPDPRTASVWEKVLAERRGWWSLRPVRPPVVPPVKDASWPRDPVDRFLLAKLEAKGLQPAQPADRRTLIRRATLVLTGLPPTPEAVEAFVQDASSDAYEKLVDRLLASPHFGERWARHWLDVVRFSETHGNEWNYEVQHAWRYRDYLTRAFNNDVPYDQLVREHIAGDLLPQPRCNRGGAFNESVIGTAFYRFGEANHDDCISLPQIGYDIADNQLDTLTKTFQAMTVACARCHDHKLDAVSMKDYYALLGILRSSRLVSHTIDAPEVNAGPLRKLRELKTAVRRRLGAVWLRQAKDLGRYLLAAQARRSNRPEAAELAKDLDPRRLESWMAALKADKLPPEDILAPWRMLTAARAPFSVAWKELADRYAKETRERAAFNEKRFVTFADFRTGTYADWQTSGLGLRNKPARAGDFVLAHGGDSLVKMVLPAGVFTHTLSEKMNGALRSPLVPKGKKNISFQVMGRHSSAVRLVSNNCQLNYKNYRALTSDGLQWVTFEIPEEADALRTYAELVTMLDNPKFPDQLSALGGDPANYRLPYEQAVADSRSYFGITRIVLHDGAETPQPALTHLRPLFPDANPSCLADVAGRYTVAVEAALQAFANDTATDEDACWLDALLRRNLLGNSVHLTPELESLVAQYRATERELSLPRVTPGLADFGPGFEQPIFARGDWQRPSETVPRRYLEVLVRPDERFTPSGSGRLELAERIANPDNPLTARVMVNRIWHHLFGTGIVRTPDDFGHVGEPPSHPELLDHLADRFMKEGWSTKRLIRSLVLTRAFQLSNRPSAAAREVDPQDRLLQHYPARRLEAEAIRDSILAVSGRLDLSLYGPSIQPYREKANADRRLFPGPLDGNGRRSIYIKNNLMEGPKFLCIFNFPGGKVTTGRRDVTNVPAQALALLNDPFVLQQAGVWAERLIARTDASVEGQIKHIFQAVLGRLPQPDERRRFEQAVAQFAQLHNVPASGVLKSQAVWRDVAHTLFNLKEFSYIP
jgi:mono/diheme cytochrome c family protein